MPVVFAATQYLSIIKRIYRALWVCLHSVVILLPGCMLGAKLIHTMIILQCHISVVSIYTNQQRRCHVMSIVTLLESRPWPSGTMPYSCFHLIFDRLDDRPLRTGTLQQIVHLQQANPFQRHQPKAYLLTHTYYNSVVGCQQLLNLSIIFCLALHGPALFLRSHPFRLSGVDSKVCVDTSPFFLSYRSDRLFYPNTFKFTSVLIPPGL